MDLCHDDGTGEEMRRICQLRPSRRNFATKPALGQTDDDHHTFEFPCSDLEKPRHTMAMQTIGRLQMVSANIEALAGFKCCLQKSVQLQMVSAKHWPASNGDLKEGFCRYSCCDRFEDRLKV